MTLWLALTLCALWFGGITLIAIWNAARLLGEQTCDAFWDWAIGRLNIDEREV